MRMAMRAITMRVTAAIASMSMSPFSHMSSSRVFWRRVKTKIYVKQLYNIAFIQVFALNIMQNQENY